MWVNLKQYYHRWQRGKKVCQDCGNHGTLERPLMFSVEDNAYYHFPSCEQVNNQVTDRQNMVFND